MLTAHGDENKGEFHRAEHNSACWEANGKPKLLVGQQPLNDLLASSYFNGFSAVRPVPSSRVEADLVPRLLKCCPDYAGHRRISITLGTRIHELGNTSPLTTFLSRRVKIIGESRRPTSEMICSACTVFRTTNWSSTTSLVSGREEDEHR